MPMLGDIDAPADPDLGMLQRVVDEPRECRDASRPADEAAVQADGHHLRCRFALGVERIELALYRGDELLDRVVAGVQEGRIVDLVGIRDRHELAAVILRVSGKD